MNRLQQVKLAKKLGCVVEDVRRTGEVRVKHPRVYELTGRKTGAITMTSPVRKKQGSKILDRFLRKLQSGEKNDARVRHAAETLGQRG